MLYMIKTTKKGIYVSVKSSKRK